jgi:exonuclease SbcC
MKLISLKLKNINSLKGEHFIDFNAPPLSGCDMFLITGPTGSGKTTILDAITAALFDRTPRLNSKTTRALKSQTADAALIELAYSVKGDNYKNIWQIDKRDNKKIGVYKNGELLRALKLNELGAMSAELIGADYDTFVKTIVLAQNKFDEFIKSKPEDRRKIIESITDNRILEAVKKRIKDQYDNFEKIYGALKQKSETLKTLIGEVNADEMAEALEAKKAALETVKAEAAAVAKNKNEYEKLKALHAELAQKKGELASTAAGYDFGAQYNEIVILRAVRDKFSAIITDIKNITAALGAKNKAADAERLLMKELAVKLKTAALGYENLKKERAEFEPRYADKLTAIATARARIAALAEITIKFENAAKKNKALDSELKAAEALRASLTAEIKTLEKRKKTLEDKKNLYGPEFENSGEALFEFKSALEKIKHLQTALDKTGAEIKKNEEAANSGQKLILSLREKLSLNLNAIDIIKKDKTAAETKKNLLENEYEQCASLGAAAALREKLAAGQKCPVCGSIDHPDAATSLPQGRDAKKIKAEIKNAEAEIKKRSDELIEAEKIYAGNSATLAAHAAEFDRKTAAAIISGEELNRQAAELKTAQSQLNAPVEVDSGDYAAAAAKWSEAVKFLTSVKDDLIKIDNQINLALNNKTAAENNIVKYKNDFDESIKELKTLQSQKEIYESDIKTLTGGLTPDKMREDLDEARLKLNKNHARAEAGFNSANSAIEAKKHLIANIETEIINLNDSLGAARASLEAALAENNFNETLALQKYQQLNKISAIEDEYNNKLMLKNNIESHINLLNAKINSRPYDENTMTALETAEREKSELVGALNRESGEINAALNKHLLLLSEFNSAKAELKKHGGEHKTLEKLYSLTKDNQFRDFVLSFHLKNLLLLANQYLKLLTGGRYELLFDIDSANAIFIKDYFNEGREREINTVSGGEAFMASLSLALGLSQVSAGDGRIEFMFLDEGFGVLDANALEDVLDMISRLNNIGRKIGIISHIQQVKERIETKIELIKNNDGSSIIKIS